jgi:hypothetical protein
MEGTIILALFDVLVIKQKFTRILMTLSLKVLSKEDPFFWDPKKWGLEELIQKIDKWNNLHVFKKLGKISTSWQCLL